MAEPDNKFKLQSQIGADAADRTAQRDLDVSKGGGSVLDDPDFGASSVFREREKERRNINRERLRRRAIMRAYRSDLRHGGKGNKLRAVARLAELGFKPDAGIRQHGEDAIMAGKVVRESTLEGGARNRALNPNLFEDEDEEGAEGDAGMRGEGGAEGDAGGEGKPGPTARERRTLQGLNLQKELENAGVSQEDWDKIQEQNPEFQTEAEKRRLLVLWKRQNSQGRKPLGRKFRGFDPQALEDWKIQREIDREQQLEDDRIYSGRQSGMTDAELQREKDLPEMLKRSRRLVRTIPADRYDELVEQNPEKYLPRQPGAGRYIRGEGDSRRADIELGQELAREAMENPALRDLPPNEFWATMERLRKLATPRDEGGLGSLSEEGRISREVDETLWAQEFVEASKGSKQRAADYLKGLGKQFTELTAEEQSNYRAIQRGGTKKHVKLQKKWAAAEIQSKKAQRESKEQFKKRLEEIRGSSK